MNSIRLVLVALTIVLSGCTDWGMDLPADPPPRANDGGAASGDDANDGGAIPFSGDDACSCSCDPIYLTSVGHCVPCPADECTDDGEGGQGGSSSGNEAGEPSVTNGGQTFDVATGGVLQDNGGAAGAGNTIDVGSGGTGGTIDVATGGSEPTGGATQTGGQCGCGGTIDVGTGGLENTGGTIDVGTGGSVDTGAGGTPNGGAAGNGGEPNGGHAGSAGAGGTIDVGTGGTIDTGTGGTTCGQEIKFYLTERDGAPGETFTHCEHATSGEVVEQVCGDGICCYIRLRNFVAHDEWLCYVSTGNPDTPRLPAVTDDGECVNAWGVKPLLTTATHYYLSEDEWSITTDSSGACVYSISVDPTDYYCADVCI